MPDRPEYYLLTSGLRDSLLAYLAKRPYEEVAEGIRELNGLQPAAVVAPPSEPPERTTA